jgi:PAS domain S-box-containing protein
MVLQEFYPPKDVTMFRKLTALAKAALGNNEVPEDSGFVECKGQVNTLQAQLEEKNIQLNTAKELMKQAKDHIMKLNLDVSTHAKGEKLFRSIIQRIDVGVILTDHAFSKTLVSNVKITEILGCSTNDIRTYPQMIQNVIESEEVKKDYIYKRNNFFDDSTVNESKNFIYSVRIIDKLGVSKYVIIQSSILNIDGKPYIITIVADISNLKIAEESFNYIKKSYDYLFSNIPVAAFIFNITKVIELLDSYKSKNPRVLLQNINQNIGLFRDAIQTVTIRSSNKEMRVSSNEEIEFRKNFNRFFEINLPSLKKMATCIFNKEEMFMIDFKIGPTYEELIYIKFIFNANLNIDGSYSLLALTVNVSKLMGNMQYHHSIQNELLDSEVLQWREDENCKIVSVNKLAIKKLFSDLPIAEVIHFTSKNKNNQSNAVLKTKQEGKPCKFLEKFITPEDKEVWVEIWRTPMYDNMDKLVSIVNFARDITYDFKEKYLPHLNNPKNRHFVKIDESVYFIDDSKSSMKEFTEIAIEMGYLTESQIISVFHKLVERKGLGKKAPDIKEGDDDSGSTAI